MFRSLFRNWSIQSGTVFTIETIQVLFVKKGFRVKYDSSMNELALLCFKTTMSIAAKKTTTIIIKDIFGKFGKKTVGGSLMSIFSFEG